MARCNRWGHFLGRTFQQVLEVWMLSILFVLRGLGLLCWQGASSFWWMILTFGSSKYLLGAQDVQVLGLTSRALGAPGGVWLRLSPNLCPATSQRLQGEVPSGALLRGGHRLSGPDLGEEARPRVQDGARAASAAPALERTLPRGLPPRAGGLPE